MSTKPIRGQRRRGVPSLVLPGDPDGCGFERERGQSSAVAWWGHLVMLAGWSLLGLSAIRNASGPREVLHDDVRTARCDGRSGPDDRSMR